MKISKLTQIIGTNIKLNRLKLELSQEDLARKAGVHRNYIGNLEKGRINPTVKTLHKVSIALKVNISRLFIGI